MKTKEAVAHFGGAKELAQVLDIWPNTIYSWGDYPPKAKQYEIQVKTGGKLRAEKEG